jgi:hypothetical protein
LKKLLGIVLVSALVIGGASVIVKASHSAWDPGTGGLSTGNKVAYDPGTGGLSTFGVKDPGTGGL